MMAQTSWDESPALAAHAKPLTDQQAMFVRDLLLVPTDQISASGWWDSRWLCGGHTNHANALRATLHRLTARSVVRWAHPQGAAYDSAHIRLDRPARALLFAAYDM